jgi:two-component system phosphate regulon sensor histidine kinase PhoR
MIDIFYDMYSLQNLVQLGYLLNPQHPAKNLSDPLQNINDILILSELENKKQNIKFQRVDINSTVNEIKCMMQGQAQIKKINFTISLSDENISVAGNRDKIKQLLINLADNAIKYSGEGGSVSIITSVNRGIACIQVVDTGIGISKEHIPRLFERFYRVDKGRSRALGGTGLGLAIVKHIVSGMNGEIKVKSEVGRGSVFTILIPVYENPD